MRVIRKRGHAWPLVLASVLALGACGTAHVAPTPTPSSASQVLSQAEAHAIAQQSLHEQIVVSVGSTSVTYSNDSAASSGRQLITSNTGEKSTVELVAGVAYVEANQSALQSFVDLPAATATKYANQWISISASAPGYQTVTQGVTLSSVFKEFAVTPSHVTAATTMDGQTVVGVEGNLTASAGAPPPSVPT